MLITLVKNSIQNSELFFCFQFNLVCDRDIFPTLALVALNLGGPIGVYMFGILNDRLGRKVSSDNKTHEN